MRCDGRESSLGSLRTPDRWSWKRNGCSEHLLGFRVTEKGKKPELRVQGVKWEKAGSAQAVEQRWAQLCKQQSGLWGRQITLGSPQDFGGAVNETEPASLSVEEQNWRLLGGSREQGQSPALPAREGDPALSWDLGWDETPVKGRRAPCPTGRRSSRCSISLSLGEPSLSLFPAIC